MACSTIARGSSTVPLSATNDPYCTISPEALKFVSPGTLKMASLLERLARNIRPEENPFLNVQIGEAAEKLFSSAANPTESVQIRWKAAMNFLNAGATHRAIEGFEAIDKIRTQTPGMFGSRFLAQLRRYQAVAHLRLGEQENCLTNHTSESCILPISPAGVHKFPAGSSKAIEILQAQLERTPNDRAAAWLLNIAHMTLGQYPDKVPSRWLIGPEFLESKHDIKKFTDVAGDLGLDVNDFAGGTITEDFDGDGDFDIMTSDWSLRGPMHYFQNNGDGTFTDRTVLAGLAGLVGGLHIVQGDYNNDGRPDVLILRGAWLFEAGRLPDSLLRNDGNGHFTDVTEEAGLLTFSPNQAATWLDFNNDGWLDLYFGYESFGENIYPCRLYRNNRNGTFTECGAAASAAVVGFVKGVTSGDFNNDGRSDLYLSRRGQPNVLLRNDGPLKEGGDWQSDWKFTDVSVQAGVTEPIASFPTWFFDYNNDGWQDIFVAGYSIKDAGDIAADYVGGEHNAERVRVYRNNQDGSFSDVTKAAQVYTVVHAMGSNFGDFDNDGWLDMYLGTGDPDLATLIPNRAFRNAGGEFFQDVTTSGGFGHLQKGHAVSFADLDRDGDQDIYHSVGGAYEGDYYRNVLFENPGHGNHWLAIKLDGVQSNAAAIGARIKVTIDEKGAERSIHRTVTTGGSFGSNPLQQHIGLGSAVLVKSLEVFWPVTGKTQRFEQLRADRFYQLREGGQCSEVQLSAFKFKKGAGAAHKHAQHPGALRIN